MLVSSSSLSPTLPSGSYQDSMPISLFAGDSLCSNSIDNTSARSPTNKASKSTQAMSYAITHTSRKASLPKLELSYKTNENEQASKPTPKAPIHGAKTGTFPFSPLLRIQLQEDGYESESEDEGSSTPGSRPKRYSRTRRNISAPHARLRGVTAPIIPTASETPLLSNTGPLSSTTLPSSRPLSIDLPSVPSYLIRPKVAKATIGLGFGFPSNHPFQTPRSSTAPALLSPQFSPLPPHLHEHSFSPYAGDVQNFRLLATIMPDSPSPAEMLPPPSSYFPGPTCPSPLQTSQLPLVPMDVVSERLQPTFVAGISSPMEMCRSTAYDSVYPPTPFGSPEISAVGDC